MNIQSGYGVAIYPGTKITVPQQVGDASSLNASVGFGTGSSTSTDKVTISDAARATLAGKGVATQSRTPFQEKMLADAASGGPQFAERLAYEMANSRSMIGYDISDTKGWEPVNKLASTGRRIDDHFKRRFEEEAALIDAQRLAIYNEGKANGSSPVEILNKMIEFTNTQSRDYLEASGKIAFDRKNRNGEEEIGQPSSIGRSVDKKLLQQLTDVAASRNAKQLAWYHSEKVREISPIDLLTKRIDVTNA